ncbi:hypothetical protein PAEPH01_1511 [Pancytospora epiphaga]|nr:hypothetical protein PAEPH01_1511 [Pancytospora epiphaga]
MLRKGQITIQATFKNKKLRFFIKEILSTPNKYSYIHSHEYVLRCDKQSVGFDYPGVFCDILLSYRVVIWGIMHILYPYTYTGFLNCTCASSLFLQLLIDLNSQ